MSENKSKKQKPLAGVNVGDAIWSGGNRWIVCAVGKTVIHAERPGHWSPLRGSWRLDGQPSRADAPAEIETPGQLAQWQAERDAAAERAMLEADGYRAFRVTNDSLHRLSIAFVKHPGRYGGTTTLPLSKALALERFVDQLIRGEE